jgi:hypothetical protein
MHMVLNCLRSVGTCVAATYCNTCVLQAFTIYCRFSISARGIKNAKVQNACGNSVYSGMDYIFLILL